MTDNPSPITYLRASARQVLEDTILPFWMNRMVDKEQGGFYGRIDGLNNLHPDAEKGAVLNARILWAFASAYRVLHKPEYLQMAVRAKDYLLAHFIDREQGGVYWSLRADGTPLDTKKQTYAIAFVIYGLAEYVRVSGDLDVLDTAIRLFEDLETHAFQAPISNDWSPIDCGYVEALTRNWQPIEDMRLSELDENGARTMNTHLHVLEAYTNLYRVWPVQRVAKQLRTLISIFMERLYNRDTHHLDCFFDEQWNGKRDIASYGHDIEACWLLNEALSVLSAGEIQQPGYESRIIHSIALASLEGLQPDGSMIHETKYIGGSNVNRKIVCEASERQWWVECEAVVGFIDQWQLTGEDEWLQRAQAAFAYIVNLLVDREYGEWFWAILPDGTPDTDNDKAGFWKCPYHNSRMCLELIERLYHKS